MRWGGSIWGRFTTQGGRERKKKGKMASKEKKRAASLITGEEIKQGDEIYVLN